MNSENLLIVLDRIAGNEKMVGKEIEVNSKITTFTTDMNFDFTIVVPQEEINIEISNSFSNAFKQGYKKVILVQNNCPEFSKAELEEANEALDYNELTIGPSDDDAYYLIGMTANYPVLFEGINFQEDEVLTETMHRFRQANIGLEFLEKKSIARSVKDFD